MKNDLFEIYNNSIRLLKDAKEFEGVVFRFGQVKILENNVLTYDWNVLDYNDIPKNEVLSEKFSDIINEVIEVLILKLQEDEHFNEFSNHRNYNIDAVTLQ